MKNLLAGLLLLGFVSNANAALLDHDTFLTDTNSGLDWLDLTETMGRSWEDVYYDIRDNSDWEINNVFNVSDGWRFASRSEFNALAIAWAGDAPYTLLRENTSPREYTYDIVRYAEGTFDGLINLLGGTRGYSNAGGSQCAELGSGYSSAVSGGCIGTSNVGQATIGSFLVRTSSVPEASSLYLLAFGLLCLLGATRRKV